MSNQTLKVKTGFYYGYIIAGLIFLILLVSYGLRFSYGVFFKPMSSELGWNNATTSLVFSISMFLEGLVSIFMGWVVDKYGPRWTTTGAGIMVGIGYCLIPTVHSVWQFILFYGVLVAIGMGGLFAPLITIVTRWFTAKRNLVNGVVLTSLGIGILITSPVANQLILLYNWRNTFLILGIAISLITVVCAQFLKRDPSVMGLVPYGENLKITKDSPVQDQGLSLKGALRTYQFWFVFFGLFTYGFCANSINIHIVPDAIKVGISATVAANILGTLGGVQILSRIGLGLLADKVGNRLIFVFGFLVFAALTFWLIGINTVSNFFLFAALFGFAQGGLASSQVPLVARLFGLKAHGLIFCCGGFGFTFGAALGPYLTGHILDVSNSYQLAFMISAIVCAAAAFTSYLLKPVQNHSYGKSRL